MVFFGYFVLKIVNFRWSFTITQKINSGKFIFHSFQHIAYLSWQCDQNEGGVSAYPSLGQSQRFLVNWDFKMKKKPEIPDNITSWLGELNPKKSGAWGWSPWWGLWGAKPPQKTWAIGVGASLTHKKVEIFFDGILFFALISMKFFSDTLEVSNILKK